MFRHTFGQTLLWRTSLIINKPGITLAMGDVQVFVRPQNLQPQLLYSPLTSAFINIPHKTINTSAVAFVKEIKIDEQDDDMITVEGVPIESDRTKYLVSSKIQDNKNRAGEAPHDCGGACPLCRLNLRRLEYSDVLILHQFIESDGRLMYREHTGLCAKSYAKVKKCVKQAWSARLLPRPPEYQSSGEWENLPRYFEFPRRQRDKPMSIIKKEYWDNSIKQNSKI